MNIVMQLIDIEIIIIDISTKIFYQYNINKKYYINVCIYTTFYFLEKINLVRCIPFYISISDIYNLFFILISRVYLTLCLC
jgi:hypothetical protein